MFRGYLIFSLMFFVQLSLSGQSAKDLVSKGDRCYDKKMYTCALDNYLKALEINPDDAAVNLKVGQTYLYSETKSKAAKFISKAYRLNPNINEHIDYYLGVSFQNTNEFKKAIEHFEELIKKKTKLASLAPKWIQECKIADSLSNYELNVIIENLGPLINTPLLDYCPIISSDDNTLIFTSNRSEDPEDTYGDDNYEDVYITKKVNGKWGAAKKISKNINHEESDAASSLSPDGKMLFLYYGDNNGDIYVSRLQGSDWGKPEPLNSNINTPYWETGASITADGKRLYFASDKEGGFGGLDIYYSDLDARGNWGKAVNLGKWVNTPENEDAPFIHPAGKTLYFSSDGHPTLGNSDIFVSEMVSDYFYKPENLGWPINTWEYDGFFTISADKKHGYFSTFKEGGQGQADIYSVTFLEPKYKPKPVKVVEKPKVEKPKVEDYFDPIIQQSRDKKIVTVLKGKIIDENTAEPLAAIISLINNETKKVISRISTDSITGDFELVIPHGGNYGVNTEKVGYLFNSINFNVPIFAEYQEIDTHIIMVKAEVGSKMILKNIFFDVGNAMLKNESIAEIEKIGDLIKTNPKLKVRINGHTDNTGNAAANKALSLRRASSVVDYLVSIGVDATKLSATGYGSEYPIVSNDDEVGGRELNRRTEIEIVDSSL